MLATFGTIALVGSGPVRPQSAVAAPVGVQRAGPLGTDDIVVLGRRPAEPPADLEIGEGEIAASGADTIRELLGDLQPFLDPTGNPTTLLVNGRLVGADDGIANFPVEALRKITVLTSAAARKFGGRADGRVVNLVLKSKFASTEVEGAVNAATAGGQSGGNLGVSRSAIDGDARWTAGLQFGRQGELSKSARSIPATTDPEDRLPTPGFSRSREASGSTETLLPAVRSAAANVGVTQPVGPFSVSLGIDASSTTSEGSAGLPTLFLPDFDMARTPSSASGMLVTGVVPLRSRTMQETLGTSMSLSGIASGTQINVAASLSGSRGRAIADLGFDDAGLDRLRAAEGAGEGGTLYYREAYAGTRTRSRTINSNLRFSAQRAMFNLPGGPMSWSVSGSIAGGRSSSTVEALRSSSSSASRFAQEGGQISVSAPLSGVGASFSALGDLALDLSLDRQKSRATPAELGYGAALAWSPLPEIQLRASGDLSHSSPSPDQIASSSMTSISRIYDYATGRFVDVPWTTGGNPDLVEGTQTSVMLGATVRSVERPDLSLNVVYRRSDSTGGAFAFPELTPLIEAAFHDRIRRDPSGLLLSVDARPIRIERQRDATISSTITLRSGGRPSGRSSKERMLFGIVLGHQFRLLNEIVVRTGMPVIDRLDGTGASRHQLDLRGTVGRRSFGGSVTAAWRSPSWIRGDDRPLRLSYPMLFNVSAFLDFGRVLGGAKAPAWTRRMKMSVDVTNLLRGYRHARTPNGSTAPGFTGDEVDPLGRSIRLSLRKQFQ